MHHFEKWSAFDIEMSSKDRVWIENRETTIQNSFLKENEVRCYDFSHVQFDQSNLKLHTAP